MNDVFRVGEHSLVFEDPEVCTITLGEHVATDEMRAVHDEVKRRSDPRGRLFVVTDASRLKSIDTEMRHILPDVVDVKNLRGSATFGMGFQTRVAALLLVKLIELAGKFISCPVRFFATREEARAWIEDLRLQP